MGSLALIDLIRPYFLLGVDLGEEVAGVLELLFVDEYEEAWDEDAVLVYGTARIADESASVPGFRLGSGTGPNDLEFDLHDIAVHFRLTAARRLAGAVEPADLTDAGLRAAVEALGPDGPGTQFRLELLCDLVTLTFPGLVGARPDGAFLAPDPDHPKVKLDLPRIAVRVEQDSADETRADADVASWGAETLNDLDESVASLFAMRPSHALFDGNRFGIGFEKAVLDLSEHRTPPDLLDRFGIGDDFTGLHLPEFRFYFSQSATVGYAGNVGARDLVIGFRPEPAIWGDLSFDMDFRGGELVAALRLYAADRRPITVDDAPGEAGDPPGLRRLRANVPSHAGPEAENTLLMIDIDSGDAPYRITAAHALDLGSADQHMDDLDAYIDGTTDVRDLSELQRMRLFMHEQEVIVRIVDDEDRKRYFVLELRAVPERRPERRPTVPGVRLEPPTEDIEIVDASDPGRVTVRLRHGAGTINGTAAPDGTATLPLAPDSRLDLNAEWEVEPETGAEQVHAYFLYMEPGRNETAATATVSGTPLGDGPSAGTPTPVDYEAFRRSWLAQIADGERPRVRVDAYASTEDPRGRRRDANRALSERRAQALADRLLAELPGLLPADLVVSAWGEDSYPTAAEDPRLIDGHVPGERPAFEQSHEAGYVPEAFRGAVASFIRSETRRDDYDGTLVRDPAQPPPPDIEPPHSQRPEWLQSIGATLRWEREPVPVAAELRGVVDFQTAHEDALDRYREDLSIEGPGPEGDPANLPELDSPSNPGDGEVEFRITVTRDPSTAAFTETLVVRSTEDDTDGLWSWGAIPAADETDPANDPWRDLAGLYFALAPLMASAAADAANGGEIAPLVVSLAVPIAVTALGIAHVDRFTHYGIELGVSHDEDEGHAVLLFDVESAVRLNLAVDGFEIVTTRVDKPVKVRYKAIGFGLDVNPDGAPVFRPVFDASRGYTLDLADSGSLRVLPALGDAVGDIIQVLGARIARTNPLNIEVDLGLGVDLGVFKVDRFGFRLPVDPLGAPTITAIGIGVDVPNALVGSGYLKILADGFEGSLDLALPSVGLRVAAGVKIGTVEEGVRPAEGEPPGDYRSATGVLATIEVEFPGGILLGGTGMAIFGFLGLFAMHYARDEDAGARNPALDWLDRKVAGDPTDIDGWKPKLDAWAFGIGVVAGTVEGGTVLNVKGMLVVELPGPRILLFVKAQLLTAKPPTRGETTGNLLAVVDIGPEGIRIGIQIEYEIEEILHLQIPVEAGFPFEHPENFYVDIGSIAEPIKATVLQLFEATAYFMVHGNGIEDFPLVRGGLKGFSIATGFQVSITWGDTDIGLYLKVAAGFDAGIGFAPFTFAGRLYLEGALHLFIVAIEARAALTVKAAEVETVPDDPSSKALVTLIHGEVRGRISLLFFTIEASVEFSLGNDPDEPPPPLPIRDLTLQSRSPALAEGTAVDRGVDTVLCRGTEDGSVPTMQGRDGPVEVRVPVDAIPLLQFEAAPLMPGSAVDGALQGSPPPGEEGWQKRGMVYVRYHVSRVELRLVAQHGVPAAPGAAPTTAGPRPYTWRIGTDDGTGDGLPVDLAMLDWKPTNTDKAILEGDALDGIVDGGWGGACTPVAEPASVLWTFADAPLGPDPSGWDLDGEAWPDRPGTRRTRPVATGVRVTETWRTGSLLDGFAPHRPAEVVGDEAKCPSKALQERAHRQGRKTCESKVLEAPFELPADALDPETRQGPLGEALAALDKARSGGLRDVLRISGGPHTELTLLVVADAKAVDAGLFAAAASDAEGRDLGPVDLDWKRVATNGDLPGRWTDTAGPWWDEVALARGHAFDGAAEYLVRLKPADPAFHLDLGIKDLGTALDKFGLAAPSWYLAAFEGQSAREYRRHADEAAHASDHEAALADSLANSEHALLLPDAEYQVVVHYSAETGRKPADGESGDPETIAVKWSTGPRTDTRTFFTEAAAPRSLDPWMLAQSPSADEPHHFHGEPVVFLFATDDVNELYRAYDRRLRAVARAASFRGSAGTPDAPFTRLLLDGITERVEALVLSPFEATARRLLADRPCRDFDPPSDRHGRAVANFKLDPLTDYVIDIEALDADGEPVEPAPDPGEIGTRPLYRRRLTTSRYRDRDDLARAVREAPVDDVRVPQPAPLTALTGTVGDDEFDRALLAAGLDAAPRPDRPRASLLWSPDPVAVPLAVYFETPEPLWRTRLEPEPVYAEDGVHILQWRLRPATWLLVDELLPTTATALRDGGDFTRPGRAGKTTHAPTTAEKRSRALRLLGPAPEPGPDASAVCARFVHDASGARTLAVLKPGARGGALALGLARELHPLLDGTPDAPDPADTAALLCEISLSGPVWETP